MRRRVPLHRHLHNAERLLGRDEQLVRILHPCAEKVRGTIRPLVHRERDVDDFLVGREHDVGNRVERVLHGAGGLDREDFGDRRTNPLAIRTERDLGVAIGPLRAESADQQGLDVRINTS